MHSDNIKLVTIDYKYHRQRLSMTIAGLIVMCLIINWGINNQLPHAYVYMILETIFKQNKY